MLLFSNILFEESFTIFRQSIFFFCRLKLYKHYTKISNTTVELLSTDCEINKQ